jgi:2-polyprenyl-6-methoxyphenol hydroxylase-like FAD-dependent oxidoreductase
MSAAPEILIAGGGIGGLTLALALHEAGIRCRVFEAAESLAELGVGINILPHAAREYGRLDVLERLLDSGVELERYLWFNRFGQQIYGEKRGRSAGYEWPQISIHRGTFHQILADVVRERLGNGALVTGQRLTHFSQAGERVAASFVGTTQGKQETVRECDLLVAADGIHSAARRQLYPAEGAPRWAGNMMWRMLVELDRPILGGSTMFSAGTGDLKVVGYEISAAHRSSGRSLFNWIAEVRLGEPDAPPPEREDWNRRAHIGEFVEHFRDWRFDWLDVPALAHASREAYAFPMVDRDPLPQWTSGRVTLLGDAAHPMWPIGSNGASQAVLDCRALTDALLSAASIEGALAAYENDRRPATAAVVQANRSRAHDAMLDLVNQRAPQGFSNIDDVVSADELKQISASYQQTARFAQEQLRK